MELTTEAKKAIGKEIAEMLNRKDWIIGDYLEITIKLNEKSLKKERR